MIYPSTTFFHTDSETAAGGAALYISNNLKAIPRADIKFTMPLVESCWAEIIANINKPNIIIGCIYRHPSANMPGFTQELQNIIKSLSNRKQHVYIIGDVNVNFLKYNEHANTEDYLNMLYSNNFLPLITKPTRLTDHSSTLIDHIYTNAPIENTTSGIALADISDNLPICCICNAPTSKNKHITYYRDYSNFCKEQYLADISQINWPDLYSTSTDLHEITCACMNKVKDIVNKHAPLKKATNSKMKQLNKPWLTQGLLKSIKRKQKMYKSHFFSKNSMRIKEYKQYSNLRNKMKAKAKDKYYNQYFKLYKENLKETWKLIGTIIKKKAKVKSNCSSRIIRNSKMYTNELDIANQFNQHFTTIGPTLASAINPIYDNPTKYIRNSPANSFYLSAVTEEYVAQLFSNLNERKASLDIPNKLIKLASHELSKPFSYIYNQSIAQGIVPNVLKVSRVTPIFKSGDATDPANYRPIAVLSPFSKILEKIVNDQLISFIDKYNILFKYQFGFRKDHSTEIAILEITDILKTSIDNNLITCGVFLDFSKAFDTVNHEILLRKLHKYGVRGKALDCFTSYLTKRTQYVKLSNVESEFFQIVCGVSQGSTLGPLLFLLYINDLANSSDMLSFRLFADDANIFYATKTSKDLEAVMNSELQKVINYCNLNKLSINMRKTNFMIITSPQKPTIHNINILNIERKTSMKYLGIYLDEHLNWKTQIAHVQGKLTKNLGILNQLRNYLNLKMLRQLYYTLIYPYLNYGAMCWGNVLGQQLSDLYSAK